MFQEYLPHMVQHVYKRILACFLIFLVVGSVYGEKPASAKPALTVMSGEYTWLDALGTDFYDLETYQTLDLNDGNVLQAEIGFSFEFYQVTYNRLFVCSNGVVQFQKSILCGVRADQIPGRGHTSPMIAMLWGDLNPDQGGLVKYATLGQEPERVFVLEFDHVMHYGEAEGYNPVTFQLQLFETSNYIEIHYQEVSGFFDFQTGLPAKHSVGLERDENTGLHYHYDVDFLPTPRHVKFQNSTAIVETIIQDHPDHPSSSRSASFTFQGLETGQVDFGYQCKLDDGGYDACHSGTKTYVNLADGMHTFSVYAVNEYGLADETPAIFHWKVDTTAPSLALFSAPPASTNRNVATFTFAGSDGTGVGELMHECKLDDGSFYTCSSPVYLTDLSNGPHLFTVRVLDMLGWESMPISHFWNVDILAPDMPARLFPANGEFVLQDTLTLTWSASDGASAYKVKIDGTVVSLGDVHQLTLTGVPPGIHHWSISALDTHGNTLGFSDEWNFTVLSRKLYLQKVVK